MAKQSSTQFTGIVDLGSNKITSLATPTTGTDAANKAYVDANAGTAPDATTSSKGIVQLAGDLGGTAASPRAKTRTARITIGPAGTSSDIVTDGTNDSSIINAAFAANTGRFFFRDGTYNITVDITPQSNTILEAESLNTKFVFSAGAGVLISGKANVDVIGFTMDTSAHVTNNKMLYILNSTNIHIEKIYAPNCYGFGVFISSNSTNTTKNVWVKDCNLRGNGVNDIIGGGPNSTSGHVENVYLINNTVIQDCTVGTYDNAIDLVRVEYAVYEGNQTFGSILFGSEASPHRYASITNNVVRPAIGASSGGVKVNGTGSPVARSYGIVISDNKIMTGKIEFFGSGTSAAFEFIISNNIVIDGPAIGIEIKDAQYGVLSNNVVQGANIGVRYTSVAHVNAIGNVILDAGTGFSATNSNDNIYAINNLKNSVVTKFTGLGSRDSVYSNQGANPTLSYDGGTITTATTVDAINGNHQKFILGANISFTFTSAFVSGQNLVIEYIQDATGSRTITLPGNVISAGGSLVLSTAPNAVDVVTYVSDGINWIESSRALATNVVYTPNDATTTAKGVVQLTNDLGGTASSPTTPTAVHITGNENIAGDKTFTGTVAINGTTATDQVLQWSDSAVRWQFIKVGTTNRMDIRDDAGTTVMRLLKGGNIGFGKTPTTTVDVNGTISGTNLKLPAVTAPTYQTGLLYFDTTEDALSFYSNDANVTLNIGQEQFIRVMNSTGASIANGVPVYISGQTTGTPNITLSINTTQVGSQAVGLTTETIANGAMGYVTTQGKVRNFDTSAFAAGATVYVGATAGSLTSTIPTQSATTFITRIGTVLVSNATTGVILVNPEAAPLVTAQSATSDLGTVLSNAGLRTAGAAYPITSSGALTWTGTMNMSGGFRFGQATITTTSTLSGSASVYQLCNPAGAITVTLPTTTSQGLTFTIKNISTQVVTLKAGTAGTIDASNTYVLSTQYKYVTLTSTTVADSWYVVGNN